MNNNETCKMVVQRVTEGPQHHFFGYYDKSPWAAEGRYLLAMENSFADRNPTLENPLTVGVVDLENNNRFEPLSKTLAWNWQQGCMLKWMPPDETGIIGFNDLQDDHYVHVTLDLKTKEKNLLPWALYDISSDGRLGGTLNFERITHTRRPPDSATSACRTRSQTNFVRKVTGFILLSWQRSPGNLFLV